MSVSFSLHTCLIIKLVIYFYKTSVLLVIKLAHLCLQDTSVYIDGFYIPKLWLQYFDDLYYLQYGRLIDKVHIRSWGTGNISFPECTALAKVSSTTATIYMKLTYLGQSSSAFRALVLRPFNLWITNSHTSPQTSLPCLSDKQNTVLSVVCISRSWCCGLADHASILCSK